MSDQSGLPGELSPLELRLMRSVWDLQRRGEMTSTRNIYDHFSVASEKPLAFTTVSTYLQRLIQKRYLRRDEMEPREYRYVAIVSQEDFREHLIKNCMLLFESENEMIHRFVGQANLDPDDRTIIQQIVERLRRSGEESRRMQ